MNPPRSFPGASDAGPPLPVGGVRLALPHAEPEPPGLEKRAAVALVLGPRDELLFIRRAEREGDPWSGDMAFPGGRMEPQDASIRHTAMRETHEEVGLELSDAHFLGALPPLRSPVRLPTAAFGVFPFVFRVQVWPGDFRTSDEVAALHRFALERLLSDEGRGTFRYDRNGYDVELPRLDLDGVRIWGLTLRMLDALLERVRGG
jgi:8-oxo-dGTP pyrophosphatase MutT (NUDIX family)